MSTYQELVDALGFIVDEVLERKFKFTRGLLGDGNGNVDVPGRDGFSYVRPHRGDDRIMQIFNKMVTASDGTPIIIGEIPWLPGLQQVLGVDWETYMTVGWDNRLAGLSSHARSHERRDHFVGADAINVYTRMLFPLRTEAIGSGTTSVRVTPYSLSYKGNLKTWPGSPGIDLSGAIPTANNMARYALVYWDYRDDVTPYGSLGVVSGTLAPISTSTLPPKPVEPAGTVPSGYVYLFDNQTVIKDEHIDDPRPLFTPSALAGIDGAFVSKLVSPDLSIDPVVSADNNGDVTAVGDVILSGSSKAIKGASSSVPDLGSTTAAEKVGNIYQAAGKDIYPHADEAGLFQRNVNMFLTGLTTHFDTFTDWTWASYTGFVTPGTINTTTYPSLLSLSNTAAEGAGRAFAYRPSFGTPIVARLASGTANVKTGLRMDDGTNDNYVELYLDTTTVSGMIALFYRYAIGGVVTGPAQLWASFEFPSQFYMLQMARAGDTVLLYAGINTPILTFLAFPSITGWTPARSGIYHEHVGGTFTNDRNSMFDWYRQL